MVSFIKPIRSRRASAPAGLFMTICCAFLLSIAFPNTSQAVNPGPSVLSTDPAISDGSRVRWRFKLDSMYSQVRPVIGIRGYVYAVDVYGTLYALSSEGVLMWKVAGAGNKGVAVGPEGTIYTASETDIRAYNPKGRLKWVFELNPRAFITLGISVGPDGNIYSVAVESLGVFSLTPSGELRWSTPEPYSRPIVDYAEIVFGSGGGQQQLYFYANARIRGVRLSDGQTTFPMGPVEQPFGQPDVSPLDNTLHANVAAFSPTGSLLWKLFNVYNSSSSFPAIDVDNNGVHYVVYPAQRLYAINPDGSIKYQRDLGESFGNAVASPDNTTLVIGTRVLGDTNSIVGFTAADGTENWRVTLPYENGHVQFIMTRPRFTPDSRTAYVNTATAEGQSSSAFIYAIDAQLTGGAVGLGD